MSRPSGHPARSPAFAAALCALALAVRAAPALAAGGLPERGPAVGPVIVGVLAYRPKPQTLAAWRPLAAALEAALPGARVSVSALTYDELDRAIADQAVDLVITNPGHYVAIHTREPMSGVLATVVEQGRGREVRGMAGVIVARADRADLARLGDLGQARIAAVGAESLGGYQAQVYELVRAGLPAPPASRVRHTGMPHDQVVEAVLDGSADVGFLRAGTIEQLAEEGKVDLARLKVLNPTDAPGFPFAASTRLYPGWPVVALAHVEEPLARRLAAALLQLDVGPVPPVEGGYAGFTIPSDYAPVEAMMRRLRLPPFDGEPAFALADVLRRYRAPLAGLAAAALVIALLAAFLARSHRRLQLAHVARERLVAELRETLQQVKTLTGLLPICMHCHKVRSDDGYWARIEQYLSERTDASVSHSLCPECLEIHYPVEPGGSGPSSGG